jgi:K+-transporting ATPase c subunit
MNRVMSPAISLTSLRAPLILLIGGLLLGGALLPALAQVVVRRGLVEQMRDMVITDAHGKLLASVFTTDHQGDPAYIWTPCASPAGNPACANSLDPIISRAAADAQAARVARARGLPLRTVKAAIAAASFNPTFSLRGEPSVNVLSVNLRLDHRLA